MAAGTDRGRRPCADHSERPGPWIHERAPAETDRLLLAFADLEGHYSYRYELPRFSWADTVNRRCPVAPKRGPIRRGMGNAWVIKGRRGMTGISYTEGAIDEPPAIVAQRLCAIDCTEFGMGYGGQG